MKKSEINIIVVDDDASTRSSLTEAIKRFGYKATAFAKPDEALSSVKIKPYHAAIIDCMLPRVNGIELVKQMRSTRFGNSPVILVSGVFRDKGYATDATDKTKAVAFRTKPFDLTELKGTLDNCFKGLLTDAAVPLQVLLSKPFSSPRDRTKVIEGLEEIRGVDLPFVICVLMEAGSSGHLNIANASGEIYGITLQQGKIVNVDSSESEATLAMLLLEMKMLTREDLKAVQTEGRRGDLTNILIEQQYLSPHVLPIVRKEQIISDLRTLFGNNNLKMNFVLERGKKEPDFGFTIEDLGGLLHQVVEKTIPFEYLKSFYQDWWEFPVHTGPSFSAEHPLFQMEIFKRLPNLAPLLASNLTIDELKSQGKFDEQELLRALHLLAFRRLIIFDDAKKVKDLADYGERMSMMLKELAGKNPFEVFSYFGVGDGAREQDVERVYKEFARANHPDLLPPSTAPGLRRIVSQVFSIVSEAHTTLTNSERRQKLINDLRQREAEDQIQAEALADEAMQSLRRGRAIEALEKTQVAMKLHPSRNVKVAHAWALLKSSQEASAFAEAKKVLDSIAHEERRTPLYIFVNGILRARLGDIAGANSQFEKAIAMDPNFLDARREKSALAGRGPKVDIFNADLTQLVGGFFKKRG